MDRSRRLRLGSWAELTERKRRVFCRKETAYDINHAAAACHRKTLIIRDALHSFQTNTAYVAVTQGSIVLTTMQYTANIEFLVAYSE